MPRVSVQIVTYNSGKTLLTTLQSLFAQDYTDFRCVAVDNASVDDTLQILAQFPQVHVIANDDNYGYAAGHNHALAATTSDYVLTLNPDVWLAPDFLRVMVATMDAHPQVGSAAGQLRRVAQLDETPTTLDGTGVYMRRNRRQGLRGDGEPLDAVPDCLTPIFGPDGAAAFYRRQMLDDIAINGEIFDEDFFMHKEDIDICWRAQLRGWDALYVPGAIAHHIRTFRPGQRQTVQNDVRYYGVRNRYFLMLKNDMLGHWLRDLPYTLVYDLGILAYMLIRERQSLKALIAAWHGRKRMLYKREIIQATRRINQADMQRWFR